MNSPDMTRLAAALAKLDDPDIIELLLDAYRPTPTPAPAPQAQPIQPELLGHIQSRVTRRLNTKPSKAGQPWSNLDRLVMIRMLNQGASLDDICEKLGRSHKAIESATEKWAPEFAERVRSQSQYRRPL